MASFGAVTRCRSALSRRSIFPAALRNFSSAIHADVVAPAPAKTADFSVVSHRQTDAPLSASASAGDIFAVVQLGCTQFKVTQACTSVNFFHFHETKIDGDSRYVMID
jgi:hypothetical protein